EYDVWHLDEWIVGLDRLDREHVEPGAGDPLLLQRLDQCRLDDGWSAAGIYEDRVALHLPEMPFAEEPHGLRRRRQMHGDEIPLPEHIGKAGRLDVAGGDCKLVEKWVEGDEAKSERPRALGDRAGDAAEGDEAERLALQTRNLQELRPPFGPAALAHHAILLD